MSLIHEDRDERRAARRHARAQRDLETHIANLVDQYTALRAEMRHVRDELVSSNAVRVRGAIARPLINGASMKLSVSAGRIAGFAVRELAGAAASVRLLDGIDEGGELRLPINLAANESTRDWLMPAGVAFGAGVYAVVTGSIEGVVYLL